MKILNRYLSRELFKILVLCHLVFMAIYLTIDFIQKIDNFMEAGASGSAVAGYFFYKAPFIMVQMAPVTTLLSIILLLCFMKKSNEITALKASGVSIFELSKPIIAITLLISICVFAFSELVVPFTSSRSNEIWNTHVDKDDQGLFYGKRHIWYKGKNAIYSIGAYNPKNKTIKDLSFYFFDDSFRLEKRIEARKGTWTGKKWKIKDGIIQKMDSREGHSLKEFEEIYLNLPERPEDFVRPEKQPEEMNFFQLKKYAETVRLEGYDPTRYLVGMHIKLAFPFVNFIMAMIGIPLALGIKKGGAAVTVALGVFACFIYLVIFGFSRSFGLSGFLPPVLSAWLANVLFFFIGSYMIMRVET